MLLDRPLTGQVRNVHLLHKFFLWLLSVTIACPRICSGADVSDVIDAQFYHLSYLLVGGVDVPADHWRRRVVPKLEYHIVTGFSLATSFPESITYALGHQSDLMFD